MIFLIFQFLDLLTAFVLVSAELGAVSWHILFYHASYLLGKGVWYYKDPLSWIDITIAIYLLLMIAGVRSVLSYVFTVYFLYKFTMYWVYS